MANPQFYLREDTPCSDAPIAFADFGDASNAIAVRIEPGDDARSLLPHLGQLAMIDISFPAFGDGRGYSSARILREAGYEGELRASGDVLIDQLSNMRRCGFDSFAPSTPLDENAAKTAFATWDDVYQKTVDARTPIWAKRHG